MYAIRSYYALSTFRSPSFAQDWGVAMSSGPLAGLTARAVVVLDTNDRVLHAELVPEIAQEPDYAAAKAARITSYNVCYTKLLREVQRFRRRPFRQHSRSCAGGRERPFEPLRKCRPRRTFV